MGTGIMAVWTLFATHPHSWGLGWGRFDNQVRPNSLTGALEVSCRQKLEQILTILAAEDHKKPVAIS
jgi:hypothetical protein